MAIREAEGREASPSAGVIDSQSVKTAYSAEVGRLFRSEVGHRADVKRATCTDPKRAIFGAPAWVL